MPELEFIDATQFLGEATTMSYRLRRFDDPKLNEAVATVEKLKADLAAVATAIQNDPIIAAAKSRFG